MIRCDLCGRACEGAMDLVVHACRPRFFADRKRAALQLSIIAAPWVLGALLAGVPGLSKGDQEGAAHVAFLVSFIAAVLQSGAIAFEHSRRVLAWVPLAVYVVLIVAVLAAPTITGPPYGRGGDSVMASMQTIVVAEEVFKLGAGRGRYGTLSELSSEEKPLIDPALARGRKAGYTFALTLGRPADSNYRVTADPVEFGKTGTRRFFVDSSGVIRQSTRKTGHASSADSPIE